MLIDTHVLIEGHGVALHFPAVDQRKRRLENVPVPDALVERILRYLAFYRPMLPAPPTEHAQAFWITRNGNPLDRDGLSKRIKERMARRTGKRFSAHMVRHSCATYIVDTAPERALMIAGVLGHSAFRTAQHHYIKGQQHMAVIKYQEAGKELIKRGRRQPKRRRRRF